MEVNDLQALDKFSEALAGEGFEVRILEKTQEQPYDVLLVFLQLDDHPSGGLQLEISFVPQMEEQLSGLSLVQFFISITENLAPNGAAELQRAVISINRFCPLVGFGILSQPAMLCFRHTAMLPARLEPSLPLVVQTTWLLNYLMEIFAKNLTQIAEGRASISEAFKANPFTHLLT